MKNSVLSFIRRSEELAERQPVVSWYCKYYAVKKAVSLGEDPDQIEKWLVELEQSKEQLQVPSNDNQEASKIVSVYGLSLFKKANEGYNQGIRNKMLGRLFKAAADVLEVLRVFEGEGEGVVLDESLNKVILFSKQQAAVLLSGAEEEKKLDVEQLQEQSISGEGEQSSEPKAFVQNHRADNCFVDKTVAEPQNSLQKAPEPKSPVQEVPQPKVPLHKAPEQKSPLQNASTLNSPSAQSSTLQTPSLTTQTKIAQAQKFARYATSALQFDDLETAKSNLRSALSLLESLAES